MNDLVVSCDLDNDGTYEIVTTIDPSAPGPANPASLAANVERAAVYAGESADELTRYVNVSFRLAADAMASCRVESRATASQHAFTAQTTPADAAYPHVVWDVALSDATGALTCSKHPLDMGASGMSTEFTGLNVAPPVSFDHELAETREGGGNGGNSTGGRGEQKTDVHIQQGAPRRP